MGIEMMEEYGKEYKTAVEQIKLSDADKQELLEAVREGKSAAAKRKKMPFYLGTVVAAALLVLVIAGNNRLFFPDSRKNEIKNEGTEDARLYGSAQSDTDDAPEKFYTQAAGSQDMMMSSASESMDAVDNYKEAEGDADGAAEENVSDGLNAGASVFYIMAYDEDVELLDEGEAENNVSQESFPAAQDGGIVLRQGKSYGAYSMEAPSCDIAMFAGEGNACDSYRIRVAGGVVKPAAEGEKKEGWSEELQVKDGERVSIQATDEISREEELWGSEAGMEEDVWQDEEIVTVTQILIEAVKGGKVVDTQKIYVGLKGERYYGLVQ